MKIRPTGAAMLMIGMMIATVFVMAADTPDKPAKAVEKSKEISNTRSASCILRITFDPSVLPLNIDMLDYLVSSSGVLGKVTKEILKADVYPDIDLVEIGGIGGMTPMGGGMGGGMMGGMGMGGMGGGMMGMGGFGGGGMTGMAGGGGGMSMPVPSDAPAVQEAPVGSSTGTTPSSNNSPDQLAADALRNQAERQMQEARQQARQAERQMQEVQRVAEQYQSRYGGRSTGYGRYDLDLNTGPAGSTQVLLVRFAIDQLSDEFVPAATEAMEAVIDLLRKALDRDFDLYKERMTSRAELAQQQAKDAEALVRDIQKRLRELSPSKELSRFQLMDEISKYQDQIRRFSTEEELNRVMLDTLKKQIDETRTKTDAQIGEDAVLRDLQKMLRISEERVAAAEKMVAAGQANQNMIQEALEKLTRANIELAQRREQLGASAGAERINDLFKRIDDISLRSTQNEIQAKRLREQIRESEGYLDRSGDYEMLILRLDLAKEKLGQALQRADALRDFQPEPPIVETIGAN